MRIRHRVVLAVLIALLGVGLQQPVATAAPGTQPLSLLGGQITGRYQLAEHTGGPLLIAIHGGGEGSEYDDAPGHSLLELSARNGYSAFALDRPGYNGSASLGFPVDSEDGLFAANAARLDDAIAEIWQTYGGSAPGVVIQASSIGGAIGLTLASRWSNENARWPLLGIAVSDVGQVPQPWAVAAWRALPPFEIAHIGPLTAVRPELLEIVGGWPRDWARIASSITVPVHYRLVQNDMLWVSRPDLIDEFAATLRTSSPAVDAAMVPGGSHPIGKSPAADAYNNEVMAFVAGLTY